MKKLLSLVTAIFCFAWILQVFPAKAQAEQDFFLVTDAENAIAEYYYYLNGTLHHISADFSLTNQTLMQDNYFIISGDYYIKNGNPLKIKLASTAQLQYLYSNTYYIIGVDETEQPAQYCLASSVRYTKNTIFTSEELSPFLNGQDLKLGDILIFRNMDISDSHRFQLQMSDALSETLPQDIFISGSLLDPIAVQDFILWGKNPNYTRVKNNRDYQFSLYTVPENFETFPAIDISNLKQGAVVPCLVHNQLPIALYQIIPDGDADGNGIVDILDVITVNKAILGKEPLPDGRIHYIDFNQNGIPDSSDTLEILKIIVGLENF